MLRAILIASGLCALTLRLILGHNVDDILKNLISPEARSLLEVLSKLAPVESVVGVSSSTGEFPISVCFKDGEAFRPFKAVLQRFGGSFRWVPIGQLPYVCIVPLTDETGDAPVSAVQARALAIRDIALLAKFVERELNLTDAASQGLVIRQLKPMQVVGPGGPALLVADPRRYLSNGLIPTSTKDKTVDYWISDEEGDLMYEELHPSNTRPSRFGSMPFLERICESKYEDLIIFSSELSALKQECRRMADASPDLRAPAERIARICDMASGDQLGIVVLGR